MSTREIAIVGAPAEQLAPLLGKELPTDDIRLEIRSLQAAYRSTTSDTSVLIAVISLGTAGLSALINGLCRVLEKRQDISGKIVIRGSSGASVEVPANTPPHEIEHLVVLAAHLEAPTILLASRDERQRLK